MQLYEPLVLIHFELSTHSAIPSRAASSHSSISENYVRYHETVQVCQMLPHAYQACSLHHLISVNEL